MAVKWLALVALVACKSGDDTGEAAATCAPGGVAAGDIQGTVDGADWSSSGVTWAWAGANLQINAPRENGWSLSVVAQSTGGASVQDAVDTGAFPITVDLASDGWALLYPEAGASFSSKDGGGGTLTLDHQDADGLVGCVDAQATGDDGDVRLSGAAFHAVPMR